MTTSIGQIETEVIVEPESAVAGDGGDRRWAAREQLQAALERRQWLRERLAAEGFDD